MTNIRRIGLTYFARYTIPKDRWADCGRREVTRTLNTRDLKEARRRRAKALAAIESALNEDLTARGLKPLGSSWEPDWQADALKDRTRLAQADATNEQEADEEWGHLPSSQDQLKDRIIDRARTLEDLHGADVAVQYLNTALGESSPIGPLSERWLKHEEPRLKGQTISHHRYAVGLLATFLGRERGGTAPDKVLQGTGIETISPDTAGSFMEWIEQDQQKHPSTCARIQSSLSSFWKWAGRLRLVKENVWSGLSSGLKQKARRKAVREGYADKRPYTADELVKLLRADPNEGRKWTYGAALFDALRLGLLTGARANEICSLRRMDITRDGTGMKVDPAVAKTDNSIREIPLHPMAQKIIAARLRDIPASDDPTTPLFPELPPGGPDLKRSWKFSSKFSAWRQSVLGEGRVVDFHSLRRCFATHFEYARAAGAGPSTEIIQRDLMGHGRGSITAGYVGRDLGWPAYTRAIASMVEQGMPEAVRVALEETANARPALPERLFVKRVRQPAGKAQQPKGSKL